MGLEKSLNYWGISPPMSFEELSYEEKRKFRYDLQSYQQDYFKFGTFKDKSVLEIGSGAGIDSCEFARNGSNVTSVDFTDIATKLTRDLTSQFNGNVARCSATQLPFIDNVFDVVYSFGVIHHIPDIEQVLNEISRVLKKSGQFMGMIYNKNSLLYSYLLYYYGIKQKHFSSQSEEQIISAYSERRKGCPYTRVFEKDELENLLEKFGFKKIDLRICYDVIDLPGYKRKIKFKLDDENLSLGWHLVFKAKFD